MSQKKTKKASQMVIDVDDAGGSQRQQSQQTAGLGPEELQRKVNEMVRHILFSDKKKIGMKRADLVKNVMKENAKAFNTVISQVSARMSDVFGYDLVEMTTHDGKSRGYILVNRIDKVFEDELSTLLDSDQESSRMGLLIIVLSLVFMNEHSISEVSLWHTLEKFGLRKDQEHEVFGNVEKLLNTDFVKQNYLERTKVQGADGPIWHYDFGARSLKEISKRKILEFVSEVYGVNDISDWKSQYQHVLEEEQGPMDTSQ